MPAAPGNKEAFLAAYRASGSIIKAAKAAGIRRELHHKWYKDPAYKAAFDAAGAEYSLQKAAKARKAAARLVSPGVEYDLRLEMRRLKDRMHDVTRELRRRIRELEAKVSAEPRGRTRQQPAEGDALLDQIARGMAKKPFSRLSSAHQEAVRDIAERIKSKPD